MGERCSTQQHADSFTHPQAMSASKLYAVSTVQCVLLLLLGGKHAKLVVRVTFLQIKMLMTRRGEEKRRGEERRGEERREEKRREEKRREEKRREERDK